MKRLFPLILSMLAAVAFVLGGMFLLPSPKDMPVFTSRIPIPESHTSKPSPTPNPAPKPNEAVPDFDGFAIVARPRTKGGTPLMVNLRTKQVLFGASISNNIGRLEFVISGIGGKTYESLLMTDAVPKDINIALIAVGANLPQEYDSRSFRGGEELGKVWPRFSIEVIYLDKSLHIERRRAEDLILNQLTDEPMPHQEWAYTGSYFLFDKETQQQVWMCNQSKSIGAVFYDPSALLQNTDKYWHFDDIYVGHPEKSPPIGTNVLVLLTLTDTGAAR